MASSIFWLYLLFSMGSLIFFFTMVVVIEYPAERAIFQPTLKYWTAISHLFPRFMENKEKVLMGYIETQQME